MQGKIITQRHDITSRTKIFFLAKIITWEHDITHFKNITHRKKVITFGNKIDIVIAPENFHTITSCFVRHLYRELCNWGNSTIPRLFSNTFIQWPLLVRQYNYTYTGFQTKVPFTSCMELIHVSAMIWYVLTGVFPITVADIVHDNKYSLSILYRRAHS